MEEARYVYCIVNSGRFTELGKVGVLDGEVTVVPVKGIAAVVSPVPYKELESSLANIMTHQRVVEAARLKSTALPVRFGVIFKSNEGVRKLLTESYASYETKLSELEGKDEYGVKVIMTTDGMKLLTQSVGKESTELEKLAKASAKASKGTAYMLKLKAEEALKAESMRALEGLSGTVDQMLSKAATDSRRLKSDHEQIVLNAAYLVDQGAIDKFQKAFENASKEVKPRGLEIHLSGPWAPYSFC